MPNTTIQFKRNNNTGQAPTLGELSNGEIGINYHDGVIFFKNDANTFMFSKNANVIVVSGNTVSDGFNTWNVDNVLVSYTPSNGTFNIFPSNTITEIGNATTDIISLGDFGSTTNVASSLVLRDAQGNIAVGNIAAVGGVFNGNVGINTGTPIYQLDVSGGTVNTSSLEISVIGQANTTNVGFGGIVTANISPSDSYKNILINGGFEVLSRGSVGASNSMYFIDRWYIEANGGLATGASGDLTQSSPGLSSGSGNMLQFKTNQTGNFILEQPLTADQIYPLHQQNVCIQFLFSNNISQGNTPTGNVLYCSLYVGTGSPQKRGVTSSFTNEIEVANIALQLTPSNTFFTWGISNQIIPANTTQASLQFHMAFTTQQFCQFDNIQLEIGSSPTMYKDRPFEEELLLCKRFYQKSYLYNTNPGRQGPAQKSFDGAFVGISDVASDVFGGTIQFETPMYKIPTINVYNVQANTTDTGGNNWTLAIGNTGNIGPVTPNVTLIGDASFSIFGTANATISTGGMAYVIGWDADAEL